jgi:14-3-3 protein epsilon
MSHFEEQFYLARVAEHCERYEDMIDFLKVLQEKDDEDLTVDERNLLSVAYKNAISERRTAWRAFTSIGQNKKYEKYIMSIDDYKEKVVSEMQNICDQVVKVIDDHFLKKAKEAESKVFFYKMKADYFRYMAEVTTGNRLDDIK